MTTETAGLDLTELLVSPSLTATRLMEGREAYFSHEEQRKKAVEIIKNFDKAIGSKLTNENQVLLRKSAIYWLVGDTDNSMFILNNVKESRERRLLEALNTCDAGNHKTAFKILSELLKEDKSDKDLLYLAAVSAIRSRDESAQRLSEQCSSLDDNKKLYIDALYEEYFGNKIKAIELYQQLLQKYPTCREALFQVALLYDLYGMDDEAIELYEQLRLLRPVNVGVMINLGINYEDRGEYQKAIECFEAVLDYYPHNKRALLYLKDALASLKMYYDEEALRQKERQTQLASQSIVDLSLSTRTKNALNKAGIYTLADLLSKTEEDLVEMESIGQSMVKEIKDLLRQKNLSLYSLKDISVDDYISSLPLSLQAKPLVDIPFSPKTKDFIEEKELTTVSDLLRWTERRFKEEKIAQSVVNEVTSTLKRLFNIRILPG